MSIESHNNSNNSQEKNTHLAVELNNIETKSGAKIIVGALNEKTKGLFLEALLSAQKDYNEKIRIENKESILGRYKETLIHLRDTLDKIQSQKWSNEKEGLEETLKRRFFRFSKTNTNAINIYLKEIDGIENLDEIFKKEFIAGFGYVFNEAIRLYSFSKARFFKQYLESSNITLPTEDLESCLESLKLILKEGWELELIIPELGTSVKDLDENSYTREINGTTNILCDLSRWDKEMKIYTIIDFSTIGFKYERLNIDIKPKLVIFT